MLRRYPQYLYVGVYMPKVVDSEETSTHSPSKSFRYFDTSPFVVFRLGGWKRLPGFKKDLIAEVNCQSPFGHMFFFAI